ncbi:MAG TPA: hypothetical protein VMV77_10475 [Bacteroidales bacterium]|nr:hypothetical protein [Bacteroidales bacterium]
MKKRKWINIIPTILGCFLYLVGISQSAPAEDENIPYLVTFGANSDTSWGDDDFCQIFFFTIPTTHNEPFYIRVFDPYTGGELDEQKGEFNTTIRFSVYGGKGVWSEDDAKSVDPTGNFESGNLLDSRTFDDNDRYDQEWFTFGPFNALEGELAEELNGYIFKVIAKGISGDDGNLYRYFLSTDRRENKSIEGGNVFTYEYTFRLSNNQNNVSQIYPYLDDKVTSVKIMNYDWDDDGFIRVVSVAKRGVLCTISEDNKWSNDELLVVSEERNTSMEIQFIKNRAKLVRNNNVVVIVQNQYGESLPFYVIPIGGIPVYNPALRMRAVEKK